MEGREEGRNEEGKESKKEGLLKISQKRFPEGT